MKLSCWTLLLGATPGGEQRRTSKNFFLHSGKHASRKFNWTLGSFLKRKNVWLVKSRPNHETKKKRLRFSHKITFTIWHGACIAGTLQAVPSWNANQPTHGGLALQQDLKCGIEKKTESTVMSGKDSGSDVREIGSNRPLAVDKTYHFGTKRIHLFFFAVYCLAIIVITSILPTRTFFSASIFRIRFPLNHHTLFTHPNAELRSPISHWPGMRKFIHRHIHWGCLQCPLEFCMVWNL